MHELKHEPNPAEVYDELFVPALFAQWGPRVAAIAAIKSGQHVLDVGCGTGVLACAAAERAGGDAHVIGLDANQRMLAVARRKPYGVHWHQGMAEALPFSSGQFDAVVSQFALMFFERKQQAIAEMLRVLRPTGRLAVAVWDSLDHSPGYEALTELLGQLFGDRFADAMRPPFTLGDRTELRRLFADAGAAEVEVITQPGSAHFASIDAMVSTERACLWTLGGLLNDDQFAVLHQAAQYALRPFVQTDASVLFDCPAHIVTATKA